MFTLGQGLLLSIPLSALLGWWLFVHGPGYVAGRAGKCGECWQPAEFCVCRPDLDGRGDSGAVASGDAASCDDGSEHFFIFTPWEDMDEDERAEAEEAAAKPFALPEAPGDEAERL